MNSILIESNPKAFSIHCPICDHAHTFPLLLPTSPNENGVYIPSVMAVSPLSIYTHPSNDGDSKSVTFAMPFDNRCENCRAEFRFAICLSVSTGVISDDDEQDVCMSFLKRKVTTKGPVGAQSNSTHLIPGALACTVNGFDAVLGVTLGFPSIKENFYLTEEDLSKEFDDIMKSAALLTSSLL